MAATLIVTGEEPRLGADKHVLLTAVGLCAMVCITVVSMVILRKWISAHDDRTRQMANQIAQERTTFVEASARRAQELNDREARLNEKAENAHGYVMGILRRLDAALTQNSHLEREHAQLRGLYEELARDHNALIRETLQERADRFTRRTVTPAARAASCPPPGPATETPAHPDTDHDRGHAPVAAIPLRRCPAPAARLAEPMQHDRPVEGAVSGPA
ncbi:hypothetical protein [Streptomyces sp. SAI-127]|uniref:hypothetical protein n=1 Tax=Streptomyces sp. SAI-127 TaxID=2940543 RepID=UPI002474879E|nr:hypothetical protein [Streptomyces sp. SAI-127]